MITGALFILMAWFIAMPKWLSIVLTVFGGILVVCKVATLFYELGQK